MTASTESGDNNPPPHREWHGVHHIFGYRPHAFRWDSDVLVGINFLPLATSMRAWLLKKGNLPLVSTKDQSDRGGYTNPYTYSGGALTLILANVVNSFHDYCADGADDGDPVFAEIERLRLFNEVVLYSARVCEATIKQLLYCTQLPAARYDNKALGQLLESPCPTCKKENGKQPHTVSLVGSLAHPFGICLEFEHCAMDHMALVNQLRNTQAAHSGIQTLNIRTVGESKAALLSSCDKVLNGFLHMMSHVENLETRMLDDLAVKGAKIKLLRENGLPADKANFCLMPGKPF